MVTTVPEVIKSGETPGSDQDPRQPLSSDDATTSSPPQHLNHRGRTTLSRFPWVSRTSGEKLGTVFMGGNNQHLKSRKSQGLVFEHQEHPSTPFKEGDSESNITTPSPGASAPAPKRRKSKALVQGFWSRLRTYPFLSPTDSSSAGKKNRLGDPARAQADSRVPGVPVADDQVHPSVEQPESPVPTFVGTHTDPRLEPVGSLGQMVERAEMGQHWALGTTTTPSNPGQNTPTMIMSESPSQLACLSFLPPSTPSLPVTPASLTSRKPRPAGSSTASTPSTQPPTTPYQVLAPSSFAFPGRPHTRSLWGVVRPKTSGQSLLGGSIAAAAPSLMASTVISCRDDDEDRSVDVKEHDPGTEIVGAGSVSPQRTEKSQGFTDANSRNHITLQTNVWYSNVLEPLVPKPIGTRSIRAGERSDEGVLQVVHELVRAVPNAHGAWVIEASVGTQQPRAEGPRVVSAEMLDSHLETKLQLVRNMEVDVHACVQCALAKHELDYMVVLQARLYQVFALVRRALGLDGDPLYTFGVPTPNQKQRTASRPQTRERSRTYDPLRTPERPHTSGDRCTLTPSFDDLIARTTTATEASIDPQDLFNPFYIPTRNGVSAVHAVHRPLGPAPRATRKVPAATIQTPPSPILDDVLRDF